MMAFVGMMYKFQELPIIMGRLRSFQIMVNFPSAPGAQENTPVQYCGYQVGRVINVSPPFLYEDKQGRRYHHIKVTIAIEKQYVDIPSNVDIRLMRRGLGSSYIELQLDPQRPLEPLDPADSRTMFLVDGMVLPGEASGASEFFPKEVQNRIETLVDSISTLADNINDILGDTDNKTNIKQTLANMTVLTDQTTKTLKSLEGFSDTGTDAISNTADRLDSTLAELQMVLAKVNTGDGTAARVLNDGRLYENLLDSSEELKMSLEQLKIFVNDINEKGVGVNIKLW
jgi:phospholipid/cholesterol/gamma-HCH transport system substrate-binding protein